MSATLEFDTGPLNWVRGEIETALKGAAERVRAHIADPSLENALRLAHDEAHMATGALQMVGLEGAAKVVASLEEVLAAMAGKTIAVDQLNSKLVLDALDNTLKWLGRTAEGRGESELALFPSYRGLRELAGDKDVFEGDLFYPNLKIQGGGEARLAINGEDLQRRMKAARAGFQRGLLAFLKNGGDAFGLATMHAALGEAEACAPSEAARSFWWACKGFVNALEQDGWETGDPQIKQLFTRLDKQLRQGIDGDFQLDEQLLRNALFFVAKSQSADGDAQAVRVAYGLDKYLPRQKLDAEQMARARPVLKLLKETLTETRNHWHAYSEGNQDALAPFQGAISRLATQAGALNAPSLTGLISGMRETAEAIGKLSGEPLAGAQLEIATTLLFMQNSVDSEDVLDPDFQPRAESQTRRLAAASAGEAEESATDLMDEGSLKAAEHALLAQLGQEIDSSLRQMEESLDAFFRDAEARDSLASLDILSVQVQGAMAILEQTDAAQLLQSAMSAIRPYLISGTPSDEEKARIADALSSLGLFVEAHCAGRQDAGRILHHAQLAFGLVQAEASAEAAEPTAAGNPDAIEFSLDTPAAAAEAPVDSMEAADPDAIEFSLDASPATNEPIAEPETPELGPVEFAPVASEAQDSAEAEAVDDSLLGLESYADYVARTNPEADLAPAAQETAATASEPPTPAPAASPEPDIDAEILEIFLEEAVEVLNNMATAADACEANANDRENLTVVRRAFHTLKGSGRMVGLKDFGEAAWGMEQMMNAWLAAEKPAAKPLLAIVRRGHDLFVDWIAALRELPGTVLDASDLLAEAGRIGHEPKKAAETPPPVAEPVVEEPVVTESVVEEPVAEAPAADEQAPAAEPAVAEAPVAPAEDEVQIGAVRLSVALYDIFKAESENWSQVLDEEIERLSHSGPHPVSEIAKRGAHTLAGISGTTGFIQLSNLALAVEAYIDRLGGRAVPRPALDTLLKAFQRINGMIANIHARIVPLQAAPLIYALNQLPAEMPQQVVTEAEAEVPQEQGLDLAQSGATTEAAEIAESPVEAGNQDAEATAEPVIEAPEAEAEPLQMDEAPAAAAPMESSLEAALPEEDEVIEEIEISVPAESEAELAVPAGAEAAEPAPEQAASEEFDLQNIVAQAVVQAAPLFEERSIQDEIDPVLLPIFLEEADTLVPEATQALRDWIAAPDANAAPSALRRVLHTIKGSARMAGAMRLGELTHLMESQVISVLEGRITANAAVFENLEERLDRMANAVDHLKYGTPEAEIAHVETEVSDTDVLVPAVTEAAEPAVEPTQAAAAPAAATPAPAAAQPAAEHAQRESATLRVRSDWVDRMVNQAGEVAIARSRIESEMHALKRQTAELAEALRRLRDHVREVEIQAESQMQATFQNQTGSEHFDPLEFDRFTRFQEVTRFLSESMHDIFTVQQSMAAQLGEADAALLQQARMNRELQQNLLRVRMVPLYSVSERLYRVVRQAARDLQKRAQLDIRGGDIEIDRGVLEKIVAPIEHLLRNAIAHGLETPEGRELANKPEFGEIKLIAKHEGNEMVLRITDDGAGLNLERIRQKALDRGLLSPGVEAGDAQVAQLIFVPGFSTAEAVTQVAGRGVGMDVVKSEIAGLGGRVEVASRAGEGVTFTIYLPLTLAVTQVVSVIANKHQYALPTTLVEQVQELKPEGLAAAIQARAIEWRGNSYPLFYLPHLLGQPEALHEIQRYNSILLMRSGSSHAAVLIDFIEGAREVVVKNIGPQLSRVTGIAGATVRGDGKVVLILNPVPLAMRALNTQVDAPLPMQTTVVAEEEAALAPLVLVVDDSLTVRKITSRLLQREGYRMDTAKDGVDALEKMHDLVPDVVLLDVEMPRMDGFELARVMRNDEKLKRVPIIMITSRTADKHRNHAMEIGVNVYLGKPYQEAVLLANIAEQLGDRALTAV